MLKTDKLRDPEKLRNVVVLLDREVERLQQQVRDFLAVEIAEGRCDVTGCAFSLDAHGINREVHVGKTPCEDAHDIAHGGTLW